MGRFSLHFGSSRTRFGNLRDPLHSVSSNIWGRVRLVLLLATTEEVIVML